ncbi:MAG TPA: GNAT family N-acetyltransferase [Lentibacillus sp.]|uniref:GNAT family N-acetyltransferase n=1 Tax=Lentibacillus sp. TaxID=1925746 RepID=UPI002B4B43F9|nr:GNAT family N-acetyltransferase [Lentibacillus sp.]HLR61374.1 GNAT family N-acetyltransferase [Lentibacillus sp.]
MSKTIRMLNKDDYPQYEAMETGIEFDYIAHIFDRLATGDNHLYGLFLDGRLVSVGGYSIYAGSYAMLGRLRSDLRFKGNGFSTEVVSYILNEVFKLNGIRWVGANTQEHNTSAQRVLEKVGLNPYITLHGALTKDTAALESGAEPWQPVTSLQRKKDWLNQAYIRTGDIFPYECYYPFPASAELFQDEAIKQWSFYENDDKTRFVITKYDQKKYHYLHAVYPWHDLTSQPGLWETIASDYRKLLQQTDDETYIWMDLTKEEAQTLPASHQFELPSPWILYGKEN